MTPNDDDDYRTAVHEAGHAVAGIRLRQPLRSICIPHRLGLERDCDGYSFFGAAPKDLTTADGFRHTLRARDWGERRIIVSYAGLLAEQNVVGTFDHRSAATDYEIITGVARALTDSINEANAYVQWLQIRARALMIEPAVLSDIRLVADALLRENHMTLHEVRRVLRRAKP